MRRNDRYEDLPKETSDFGGCAIEDTSNAFGPPDCRKGDVARIWLYMHERYDVEIPPEEMAMLVRWAGSDPVSPRESEHETRIGQHSHVRNPFV